MSPEYRAKQYTCGVRMDDVVARGRQRWIQHRRQRHGYHVLLSQGIVPSVHNRVMRLAHQRNNKEREDSQGNERYESRVAGRSMTQKMYGGKV